MAPRVNHVRFTQPGGGPGSDLEAVVVFLNGLTALDPFGNQLWAVEFPYTIPTIPGYISHPEFDGTAFIVSAEARVKTFRY
jgi:hypothetical protein